jgi:4-hydroxybenzoate polyprenyltransferase
VDYLKLVRFPLLFTALADPIAGYCLAMPAGADPQPRAVLVLLASAALYAAGMVFNDCADMVRDRTLHPERPLAAGRIPFASAFVLGVVLGLVAIVAAQAVNFRTGATALGIALGVLFYNGAAKRNWVLGAATMGALRAGNVLMGFFAALPEQAAGAAGPAGASAVPYLGVMFLYGTFLTLLSGLEEPPPRPRTFAALVFLMALTVAAANALFPVRHGLSLALTLLLAVTLIYKGLEAFRAFDPGLVSTLVKIGVLGIIPLDAAAAAGTGNLTYGTVLLLLLIPPVALLSGFVRLPGLDRAN